jgi:hypothetical protein
MFFNFLIPIHFITSIIYFLIFILLIYLLTKHYFKKTTPLKKIIYITLLIIAIIYLTSFLFFSISFAFNLFQIVFTPIIWISIYFIQLISAIINLGFPIYLIIFITFLYFKKPNFFNQNKHTLIITATLLIILYIIYTSMLFVFFNSFMF